MSEHYITLIPADPRFVPDKSAREAALAKLSEIAPRAREYKVEVEDKVAFFDCGENFMRVLCPKCSVEFDPAARSGRDAWWVESMDKDYVDGGFTLSTYEAPCCGASLTLDELVYDWPQGFASFALSARNADIGRLVERDVRDLESALGTTLRVLYRHY